jgi:hypothetical protein
MVSPQPSRGGARRARLALCVARALCFALALRIALALAGGPGVALAQAPAVPPAEPPALPAAGQPAVQDTGEDTRPPGALDTTVAVAKRTAERARTMLDQHIVLIGAGYHEIALRADTSSDSKDAAVFLPKGPSGKGLLGDRVGRTTTFNLDLLSPVRYFEGSKAFGWGYNFGVTRVRFDKYESFISDRVSYDGELTGTFVHFIPTLVLSRPQSDDSSFYARGELGIGVVAYRFTGQMHIQRNYLISNVNYDETFAGDGKVRYGPAFFVNDQFIWARHVSLGVSMLIMSYAGYYYTNIGVNAGLAFVF